MKWNWFCKSGTLNVNVRVWAQWALLGKYFDSVSKMFVMYSTSQVEHSPSSIPHVKYPYLWERCVLGVLGLGGETILSLEGQLLWSQKVEMMMMMLLLPFFVYIIKNLPTDKSKCALDFLVTCHILTKRRRCCYLSSTFFLADSSGRWKRKGVKITANLLHIISRGNSSRSTCIMLWRPQWRKWGSWWGWLDCALPLFPPPWLIHLPTHGQECRPPWTKARNWIPLAITLVTSLLKVRTYSHLHKLQNQARYA